MLHLGKDILTVIFRKLTLADRRNFSMVCHKFSRIFFSDLRCTVKLYFAQETRCKYIFVQGTHNNVCNRPAVKSGYCEICLKKKTVQILLTK